MIAASLAWGVWVVSRRGGRALVGYATLLGANLVLVVTMIGTGNTQGARFFIAVGGFIMLVIVPSLLRALTRRAMSAERFGLALRLSRVRELLQPGAGGSREREMLSALALARQGRTQEAIGMLEGWGARGGPERLLEAQEQIVALLSMERRFPDAIAYGEALGPAATRRPVLCAGLVRAYAEVGNLGRAAELLERLETGPAGTDASATELVNQARLFFLAQVGEADALAYLLSPNSGFLPSMPAKVRAYWRGVALMRAGRVDAARAELLRAQALAGSDEERLRAAVRERIAAGPGEPASEDIVRFARGVALRARVHRGLPHGSIRRVAPLTVGLGVLLIALTALIEIGGSSGDLWSLIRAGGLFRPAVGEGDWWRLVSATFLHGGWLHLGLNVYALIMFGRFVEPLYGTARFFVLYVASGVIGFWASFRFSATPLSVGASGSIFGLLGAAIAILLARRGHWPEGWRRSTLGTFAFLAAINIYIGFKLPMIDNAAHLGGFASGLVLGVLLVPGGLLGSGVAASWVVAILTTGSLLAVACGAIGTLRTDSKTLLTRLPARTSQLGSVLLRHPGYWSVIPRPEQALIDPAGGEGWLGAGDPRDAARKPRRALWGDDIDFEVSCLRLAVGPTFCMRYPASARAAYLPVLSALASTSRPAPR